MNDDELARLPYRTLPYRTLPYRTAAVSIPHSFHPGHYRSLYLCLSPAYCLFPGTAQPSPALRIPAQWQLPGRWLDFFLLLTRIRTPLSQPSTEIPPPSFFDPGRLAVYIRLDPI